MRGIAHGWFMEIALYRVGIRPAAFEIPAHVSHQLLLVAPPFIPHC